MTNRLIDVKIEREDNRLSGVSMFRTATSNIDPNETKKRSKEVLDNANVMEISIGQSENNHKSYREPLGIGLGPVWDEPGDERTMQEIIGFGVPESKTRRAIRMSIDNVNASQAITDAYFKGQDLTALLQEKQRLDSLEPITGDNFVSDTFYKGIAVAAPMVQSLFEASPFAAITTIGGAITGAVVGNLLGGGLTPEELITVPAGAKIGLAAGTMFGAKAGITGKTAEYWYRQGVGQMIHSMNKNGVDMKYAGPIAAVAGIPYAAIEFAQMSQLTPGLRQGVQNIGVNSMLKAFTAAAKKYGKTYVIENVEEVLQEGVQIAAEDVGNLFEGNDLKFDKDGFIERANRLALTSIEAGQAMLLLPFPGAVVDVSTGVMQVKNKNNFVKAVQEAIGVPKETAQLAADMLKDGKSVKEVDQMLSQVKAGIEPAEEVAEEAVVAPEPPAEAVAAPEPTITPEEEIAAPVEDTGKVVKEPFETSDLATAPNIPESRVKAERQTGGKYKLFFRGTRNEVFEGELFNSASEARQFFKVQKLKAQEAQAKQLAEKVEVPKKPVKPKQVPKAIQAIEEEKQVQRDILGGVDPLIQIHKALKEAKAVRPKTVSEQKAERKRRVGAAAGALKASLKKGVPAEQAILKSTGLLKGPLTEYEQLYESIEESLDPDVKNAAYLKIAQHPDLKYFEVIDTQRAFQKLIAGTSITPREAQMIEKVFGKSFEEAVDKQTEKSGLYDRLITLWKAGLLTGIKTSGLNVLSTAGHAVSETAKSIPEAFIDKGLSLVTGERTTAFTVKGFKRGFRQGLDKGWSFMKTGFDERDVGKKYDYKKTNFGTSKLAKAQQAYTEFIFHLLGAEDQPWYYGSFSRSLYSQSIAQGKNKGLKGKELDAFVDKLQARPTDEMLLWAQQDAETAIYTNRTNLGDLGRAIQKVKGGDIIAPFTRTPSAVAMQIINYSPIGVVSEISKQIHNKEFNQRSLSQAGGRSVIGTGTLWLGTQLFKAGLITLGFPKNERERKLFELEGRKPNSIKVGNKWRDVQALGPAGNLLVIGGYFQQALESKGSPSEAMITAMAGGAKSFTEQTFVRGVNLAVDALTDPEASFERWFTSMAGSVVPTIVADIARAQDDISRRAVGPKERIQSRLPIFRQNLPPALDVFGQDLPRYGGNVLETMIDPTRPSKIRQDTVVDELRRLWDKNIKVSPTQLGDKKGFDILTKEENTQLWQRSGELTYKALFNLVNSAKYKDAGKGQKLDPDFLKGQLIKTITNTAKTAAKVEMVDIKVNQGVSLMKLAESGLYTIKEYEMLKFYGGIE